MRYLGDTKMIIIQKPLRSNFTKGRKGYFPMFVCVHIGEGSQNSIYQTFQNPASWVSAHYSVDKDGVVWQFVDEGSTAWANGIEYKPTAEIVLNNKGVNKNLISVSIEHEGSSREDLTLDQYKTTAQLVKEICDRWNIPLDRKHIIRHNEIRRDKTCPGKMSVERIIALASPSTPETVIDTQTQVEALKRQIGLLQRLLELFRKLSVLKVGRLGSNKTMSNFLKINLKDLSKGLAVAVLVATLQLIMDLLNAKGLDFSRVDFVGILDIALKSGGAYLLKNLLSDSDGNVLGAFGGTTPSVIGEKGDLD